jgi:hypothetical protein
MGYTPDTIAATVKKLNEVYLLPAIQREFVWEPDQVVKLFDSVMRGYPIGSFLFWELEDVNRERWDVYKFLDLVKEGGTHNELANTSGTRGMTLVLDGQQRLTSLNVGLRGTYNPDWAIIKQVDGEDRIYLVRETKSTLDDSKLRPTELAKIKSAKKHFAAIGLEGTGDMAEYDRSVPGKWNI